MNHPLDKKAQIAKQLGVSVQVLEQYLQLKRAESADSVASSPTRGVVQRPLSSRLAGRRQARADER